MATIMADQEMYGDLAPKFAPFLGMAGIAFAMIFGCRRQHDLGRRTTHTEDNEQVSAQHTAPQNPALALQV